MTDGPVPAPNPYPAAPAAMGGGAGRASLILAIVLVVFGVITQVVGLAAPRISYDLDMSAAGIGLFFTATSIVTAVVAAAVIALGAIGIQPSQARGRLAAAAGLAIGATHLLGVVVGFLAPLVLYAVP